MKQLVFDFWTVIDPILDEKRRVLCRCRCGTLARVYKPDLVRRQSRGCRSCFGRRVGKTLRMRHARTRQHEHASTVIAPDHSMLPTTTR